MDAAMAAVLLELDAIKRRTRTAPKLFVCEQLVFVLSLFFIIFFIFYFLHLYSILEKPSGTKV